MPTPPTSILNRLMGLEAFTDPIALPAGSSLGGRTLQDSSRIVPVTGSTLTVTQAMHSCKLLTLSRALGIAVTLPNAIGSGAVYTFLNITSLSGGSHVLTRGTALDAMVGLAFLFKSGATNCAAFQAAANSNVITLNGGTTGGLGGDFIELVDIGINQWFVSVSAFGSSTLATPFSNS